MAGTGLLVISIESDNPGLSVSLRSWVENETNVGVPCDALPTAWHRSQNFALQCVERESDIGSFDCTGY
ncbi:hypothetical protein BDW75DRAFT_182043 [Aspergillus navahoensis]